MQCIRFRTSRPLSTWESRSEHALVHKRCTLHAVHVWAQSARANTFLSWVRWATVEMEASARLAVLVSLLRSGRLLKAWRSFEKAIDMQRSEQGERCLQRLALADSWCRWRRALSTEVTIAIAPLPPKPTGSATADIEDTADVNMPFHRDGAPPEGGLSSSCARVMERLANIKAAMAPTATPTTEAELVAELREARFAAQMGDTDLEREGARARVRLLQQRLSACGFREGGATVTPTGTVSVTSVM